VLPRRGWVGWVEEHSKILGAISVWIFVAAGGLGALVASASGGHNTTPLSVASGSPSTSGGSGSPGAGHSPGAATGKGGTGHGGKSGGTGPGTNGGTSPPPGGSKGGNQGSKQHKPHKVPDTTVPHTKACSPTQPKVGGSNETGITSSTVTIGEILSDVSQLPQQLRPSYEGLSAWVNLVNKSGGICGRRIEISERNDSAVPQNHQSAYQSLASQVFAFVATESLQDQSAYQSSPPYNPSYKDGNTNEYVPDVGGLAFGYPRAQSMWHAGIFGSLSPTLTGGGQFAYMMGNAPGTKCKRGGVLYLNEPTGASKDQADIGSIALNAKWGGNLPSGEYQAPLESPEPYYEQLVQQMIGDGVNCVFTYADSGSNVNLVTAMQNQGVWPPDKCSTARKAANQCFYLTYMPFTSADAKFVSSAGAAGTDVTTFIPHVPLNETSDPAVRQYLAALAACNHDKFEACDGSAQPSTFSVIGFASGVMFGQALAACGAAPTRGCVMSYLQHLKNFNAGGLVAPITPFECVRANYNGTEWCWKKIFYRWVMIRELGSPSQGINAFHRIFPSAGVHTDSLHVVRGTPG
jgi:hypothetical protein